MPYTLHFLRYQSEFARRYDTIDHAIRGAWVLYDSGEGVPLFVSDDTTGVILLERDALEAHIRTLDDESDRAQ